MTYKWAFVVGGCWGATCDVLLSAIIVGVYVLGFLLGIAASMIATAFNK